MTYARGLVYNNQSWKKGGNAVKKQWWKNGWMMLAVLLSASGVSSAQADGTIAVKEDGKTDRRIMRTQSDKAQNRHWAEGDFEGVIADTGDGKTLAVLNPDKSAKWIVVFDRPAISKELKKRAVRPQQAKTVAGALRQEIAQEHKQIINDWKANGKIAKVNARFDMLINGAAVEATGEQIEEIAKQPGVAAVHPDYMMQINLADSVPLIGAPDVWAMNDADGNPVTGSGIRVAVIDTGVDYTHTAFGSCSALNSGAGCRVVGGYDFVNKDADPKDDNNHGTHVAGIIAGRDATITGVAPEASLYAYKVLNSSGSGYSSDIIAALERAVDPDGDGNPADHVDAARLSLGGSGGPADPLSVAVDQAVDQGISVVVAAGNSDSGYSTVGAPGAAAKAITVGASDKTDKLASFSSRGPVAGSIIKPDLVAPGVAIKSSVRSGGYAAYDGTSMAAPHVTGAVALLKQLHPAWTPAQLKAAVANLARDLGLNPFAQGSGRLQLAEAASSTYLATPNSLSMGLVDNDVPVWSSTQQVTVYNDADTEQTINLSVSPNSLPNGLTASLSENSVTLAAGASQDVEFTVTVDNSVLPYPAAEPYSYSGKVVMTNGAEVRRVPFALIKAAQLTLNWDVTPDFVRIHNRKASTVQLTLSLPASPSLVALPPGTYDIISWWLDSSNKIYTVFKEGIVVAENATTYSISKSDATHEKNFKLKDAQGVTKPAIGDHPTHAMYHTKAGRFSVSIIGWNLHLSGFVSDASSEYRDVITGFYSGTANVFYNQSFSINGINSDIELVNDAVDSKRIDFTYNSPVSAVRQ
jgi:subtilisin family serine protease